MLVIGVGLPLLSLVFSQFFDFLEGAFDGDGVSFGSGDVQVSFLPVSPIAWCILLTVAGGLGEILVRVTPLPIYGIWGSALFAGYLVMFGINNFLIQPLKRAKNFANDDNSLIGTEADVMEQISQNGVGAVRIIGKSGAAIYSAVAECAGVIVQGERVEVVAIEDGKALVRKIEVQKFSEGANKKQ